MVESRQPETLSGTRQALAQGEQIFRLLVESVRDYAIFMLDASGHIMTWNIGAERLKGYAADEIIGQHFSKFYLEDEVRSGKCERELVVASEEGRVEDEGWRVRKDGTRFWASVVITAVHDDSGELVGYAKVTRDLTERVKAEQERVRLAQTEEANRVKDEFIERETAARRAAEEARSSLAITLQSIGDAVIATDERGNVTLMNPVAERLTGWTLAEANGHPVRPVFHIVNEATRRLVESPVDRVLREGIVVGLANHTLLIARDGTETPISDSGAPVRDETGTVRGVVLVFRDASEEYRANQRRQFLSEASTILSASLDHRETLSRIAQLVVPRLADWCSVEILDDADQLQQVGVAHTDPFKVQLARDLRERYPLDPDAARGVPNVIRSGRSEHYAEISDEMLVQGARDAEHLRLLRELQLRSAIVVPIPGGKRALGAITMVFSESGRRYSLDDLSFAEELARRASTPIKNARLYAAEQRARDLADTASRAKDEFLALVSHELRTPLSAIVGWSKLLATATLDEQRRQKAIETIGRNGDAMTRLVDDLIDVSRIVSGKLRLEMVSVDLPPVIHAAVESVRPAADAKSVAIDEDLDPSAGPINGDAARLQQVVWNLVNNAVKFTPAGGRVTVSLYRRDSHVEIAVGDTGRGIEPRFLPHVFEPFRQADTGISRSSGGLGLGLAIVKQLLELHGGRIEARSEGLERGAIFVARLPLPVPRQPAGHSERPSARVAERANLERRLQGLHVLVVEDEVDMRELLEEALQDLGCRVSAASSVSQAMVHFGRADPPDVLLSDIGLPGESGYDLIRRVRALPAERGGQVPAAAVTAYTRAEDQKQVLDAGFDLHVGKPVDPDQLAQTVATLASMSDTGRRRQN